MGFWSDMDPGFGKVYGAVKDPMAVLGGWWGDVNHKEAPNLEQYGQDREALQRYLAQDMVGADPYNYQINNNLGRLNDQASGRGPSLAGQQYDQAFQTNLAQQRALAAGGRGPGGARLAQQNIGRSGAGLAGGMAQAQLAERLGAQSAYNQALSGAQSSDLARNNMNVQARLELLRQLGVNTQNKMGGVQFNANQPTAFDKVMHTAGSLMPLAGMGGGGGGNSTTVQAPSQYRQY